MLANPERLTVANLFDVLVIDRSELVYQAQRGRTEVDCATLVDAFTSEKLDLSLAELIARRRQGASRDAPGAAHSTSALPPRTA